MSAEGVYGPALPPGFEQENQVQEGKSSKNVDVGGKRKLEKNEEDQRNSPVKKVHAPALMPKTILKDESKKASTDGPEPPKKKIYGPQVIIPSTASSQIPLQEVLKQEEEEEEEEIIGPKPPTEQLLLEAKIRQQEMEASNQEYEQNEWSRVRGETKVKTNQREDWMLSIPEGKTSLGSLGPRQFSKSGSIAQKDSSWMASPLEENQPKPKPIDKRGLYKQELTKAQDDETQQFFQKFNKIRGPSLVEMHQQSLTKKDKENGPQAPLPFDRERDFTTRRVDPTARQRMIVQSKELDSNFTTGNKKFL